VIYESTSDKSEYDTKFLHSVGNADFRQCFSEYKDEAIVRDVLNTWGSRTTAEILDYVYFQTEPMEHGIRNEPLDFSKIMGQVPGAYKRPTSGKSKNEIEKMRREFMAKARPANAPAFAFTPPQYDSEFLEALEKLDSGSH